MKRNILVALLAFIFIFPALAQKDNKGKPTKEEMRKFKLEFLAEQMELADNQKAKFNEIYTQMENERWAVFKKMKEAEKRIKDSKNASESDYEKASKEINQARQQMSVIESNYDKKFEAFLSKKQIFKMKEAENAFMERMKKSRDKKRNK